MLRATLVSWSVGRSVDPLLGAPTLVSVGLSFTQTFYDPPGASIGLLGLVYFFSVFEHLDLTYTAQMPQRPSLSLPLISRTRVG